MLTVHSCNKAKAARKPHRLRSRGSALDQPQWSSARPLLIFDSGVGGLSVLAAIRTLLPQAPLVYVADSAGFPYGTKTEAEIAARVPALLGRLAERFDPRADRHRVQHRLDHRARRGARRRWICRSSAPCRRSSPPPHCRKIPRDRRARHRGDRPPALCRSARGGVRQLIARSSAMARRSWSTSPKRSCAENHADPAAYRRMLGRHVFACRRARRIDTIVLACTHFPLVADELAAASPGPSASSTAPRDCAPRRLADARPDMA